MIKFELPSLDDLISFFKNQQRYSYAECLFRESIMSSSWDAKISAPFSCLKTTFPQTNPGNLEFGLADIPDHYSMKQKLSKQLGGEPTAKQAHQCAKCKKHLDIDEKMAGPFLCGSCQGGLKQ